VENDKKHYNGYEKKGLKERVSLLLPENILAIMDMNNMLII